MSALQCYENLKLCWKTMALCTHQMVAETQDYLKLKLPLSSPLFSPIFLNESATQETLMSVSTPAHSVWLDSERNSRLKMTADFQPLILDVPMMAIPLNQHFKSKNKNIQIKVLAKNDSLNNWIQPVKESFYISPPDDQVYQNTILAATDNLVHFVATNPEGLVVGSASLFVPKNLDLGAGFYNLAVLPTHRCQGIGHDLHVARLQMAQELGYSFATLQATPAATKLDIECGFKILSRIHIYHQAA